MQQMKHLKGVLDTRIKEYLTDYVSSFNAEHTISLIHSSLEHSILLASGGKRARAFLVALMAEDLELSHTNTLHLSLALEFFHTFILIHDDINDSSDTRRNVSTLHTFLKEKTGDTKLGLDYAIIIGDLIHNWSHSLLSTVENKDIHDAFHDMVQRTVRGQLIDIFLRGDLDTQSATIKQKDLEKTAYYTFVSPMIMGSLLKGECDKACRDFLTTLGITLGLAFQLQDDYLDIYSYDSGKKRLSDIQEGQVTQIYHHALKHASSPDKEFLKKILGKKITKTQETKLLSLLETTGARKWSLMQTKNLFAQSKNLIAQNTTHLTPAQQATLLELIEYLEQRKS